MMGGDVLDEHHERWQKERAALAAELDGLRKEYAVTLLQFFHRQHLLDDLAFIQDIELGGTDAAVVALVVRGLGEGITIDKCHACGRLGPLPDPETLVLVADSRCIWGCPG